MLSYSVGYSETEGHDSGWVVMACDLVGGTRFELVASSVSGTISEPVTSRVSGSPAILMPLRVWRSLQACLPWPS